jgi:hypothetical protein
VSDIFFHSPVGCFINPQRPETFEFGPHSVTTNKH